jgi:hypothetical protein
MPRRFAIIVPLLFFSSTAAASSRSEAADWFRSLKEPGTERQLGDRAPCCSPERDCQTTDYETDAEGGYWITVEGERIQIPPDKILSAPRTQQSAALPACVNSMGTRLTLKDVLPGRYDVKVIDRKGRTCLVRNVEIVAGKPYAFSVPEKDLTD